MESCRPASESSCEVVGCRFSSPRFWMILIILANSFEESKQGPNEKRLLRHLFEEMSYNKLERPVVNESVPLVVHFGLVLQQIIDVDEKNQIIHTNLWLNMEWRDHSLVWNESEYGGVKTIRVPPTMIWRPDLLMYNSADEDIDSTFPANVVVSSTGKCLWVPPGMFLSTCKIDISWFPFDEQRCKMKFGSWTYDSSGIDLQLHRDTGDISSFIPNGEWELKGLPATRNLLSYDCCPEQYVDVTFTIHIRRRSLYYGFNLIIPCVLISTMALLTFTLPPDAGEKISLGVTILLSLTVFLLLVAETMPPTSDAVPLIGSYFAGIMLMCSLSVVCTVLVLNFHHRTPDTHEMPSWIRKSICVWLAWIVRMERPSDRRNNEKRELKESKTISLELNERSSRSLLANVLDLDDDFRSYCSGLNHERNDLGSLHGPMPKITPCSDLRKGQETNASEDSASHPLNITLLQFILKELQFLTEKLKADDIRSDLCSDWKFAAMVIDRLCLWLFTVFTVVSTFAILLSPPDMLTRIYS